MLSGDETGRQARRDEERLGWAHKAKPAGKEGGGDRNVHPAVQTPAYITHSAECGLDFNKGTSSAALRHCRILVLYFLFNS